MEGLDGPDPQTSLQGLQGASGGSPLEGATKTTEDCALDDLGFAFVSKTIEWTEGRGLEDQGLYRIGGVASRVNRFIQNVLDRKKLTSTGTLDVDTTSEDWEIRTVTSALKQFFRNLPEPLLTYRLYSAFITAAKLKVPQERMDIIHCLVHDLPTANFNMLHLLMKHLKRVADKSDKNRMTVSNLSMCLGPTLLRPEDESMSQGLREVTFANVVVEILIENCDMIFTTTPAEALNQSKMMADVRTASNRPHQPATYATIPGGRPLHGTTAIGGGSVSSQQHVFRSSSHDQLPPTTSRGHQLHPPYGQVMRVGPQSIPHPIHTSFVDHSSKYQQQQAMQPFYLKPIPGGQVCPSPLVHQKPSRVGMYHLPQAYMVTILTDITPNTISQPLTNPYQGSSLTVEPSFTNLSGGSSCDSLTGLPTNPGPSSLQSVPSSASSAMYSTSYGSTNNEAKVLNPPSASTNLQQAQMTSLNQPSSLSSSGRRVRALYKCVGGCPAELSFEPNAIIYNVRPSEEPGWLEGTYLGKTGLIPENYVQNIPD